jgi:hypothetical protein
LNLPKPQFNQKIAALTSQHFESQNTSKNTCKPHLNESFTFEPKTKHVIHQLLNNNGVKTALTSIRTIAIHRKNRFGNNVNIVGSWVLGLVFY